MAWVIAVLGAALAAGGGVALWNGSGYIRLDWGQAQTVAGTVALSAGVVTIAIAAVLFAIRDALRSALAGATPGTMPGTARDPALRPAPAGTAAPYPAAGVGLEAVHLDDASIDGAADGAARDATGEGGAAGRPVAPLAPVAPMAPAAAPVPARGGLANRLARVGMPRPDRAEPAMAEPATAPPMEREPALRDPPYAEAPYPEAPYAEPPYAEPVRGPRPRAAPTVANAAGPIAVPEAPRPLAPAPAEAPTVVGRYEANGASYVLFSDGTIEVETDSGTHRFASMADLKSHIEHQGSA